MKDSTKVLQAPTPVKAGSNIRVFAVVGTAVLGVVLAAAVVSGSARRASTEASRESQLSTPVTSDATESSPTIAPASTEPAVAETLVPTPDASVPTPTADPEVVTTDVPSTSVDVAVTVAPDVEPAPETPDSVEPQPPVVESIGIVRNGQIFLSGAVPTAEAGQRIVDLAAAIIGPDNVINNYVVDPRATDPNLGNLTVEDTINFDTDSAVILPGSETLLNQGLALMTVRPAMTVTIVGHTDSRGTEARNMELSLARAEAVKQWFVERGIDGNRFTVAGAGASEPIGDNATAEGRRVNRRIQFLLENLLAEG